MNLVVLEGRLGRDPELKQLSGGSDVCEFSLATDESYKDRQGNRVDKAEWHAVKVWGRSAVHCANYLQKGSRALVVGKIQTRQWQDRDGNNRYTTEVVVSGPGHKVTFLDPATPRRAAAPAPTARREPDQDPGPAFPTEAGGMDHVPF